MPGSNPKSQAYFLVDIGENGDADSNVKVSLQDSWTEQETNVLRYSHSLELDILKCFGSGFLERYAPDIPLSPNLPRN